VKIHDSRTHDVLSCQVSSQSQEKKWFLGEKVTCAEGTAEAEPVGETWRRELRGREEKMFVQMKAHFARSQDLTPLERGGKPLPWEGKKKSTPKDEKQKKPGPGERQRRGRGRR